MTARWAAGLMTGTVLDGNIDCALIRSDGQNIVEFGPWRLAPYPAELRDLLKETLDAARRWDFAGPEPGIFASTQDWLTRVQADAVRDLVQDAGLTLGGSGSDAVGLVGFHGQTVLHRAPVPGRAGRTRQLGDGALMARLLGVPVAYDFRSDDVAVGGQGAPLSPVYHAALLRGIGAGAETAVLNLGGVANITWNGDAGLVAFDTGPANAPIDDFVRAHGCGDMDRDGALALAGRVDEGRLAALLDHPYLARLWPKSLDRFDFPAAMADGCTVADGAALLTAFTAAAVGRGLDLLRPRPTRLIVCGGGRRNPAIMAALRTRAGIDAIPAEAVGWRGDAVEAECFAYLALRVQDGLAISYPGTTGVGQPMTGGRIAG